MLNSRIDLFDQAWIDTIFEGRNKNYGAYDLRRRESRMTIRALIIGAILFSFLISLPLIIKELEKTIGTARIESIDKVVEVIDLPPVEKPIDAVIPPAPPVREAKTSQDVKKFTNLVAATADEVSEVAATQEELKNVRAGARDLEGQEDGEIVIGARAVEHDVDKSITEYGTGLYDFNSVEVQPSYQGGIQKFREYLMGELTKYSDYATRDVRMELEFVIERDGSLSNIKVLDDGGNSRLAARATEILAKSKKWNAGLNNGVPVRVTFSIPIVLKVGS